MAAESHPGAQCDGSTAVLLGVLPSLGKNQTEALVFFPSTVVGLSLKLRIIIKTKGRGKAGREISELNIPSDQAFISDCGEEGCCWKFKC